MSTATKQSAVGKPPEKKGSLASRVTWPDRLSDACEFCWYGAFFGKSKQQRLFNAFEAKANARSAAESGTRRRPHGQAAPPPAVPAPLRVHKSTDLQLDAAAEALAKQWGIRLDKFYLDAIKMDRGEITEDDEGLQRRLDAMMDEIAKEGLKHADLKAIRKEIEDLYRFVGTEEPCACGLSMRMCLEKGLQRERGEEPVVPPEGG